MGLVDGKQGDLPAVQQTEQGFGQQAFGRDVDQIQVLRANTPFFIGILAFLLIAIAVPGLATWLPELLRD